MAPLLKGAVRAGGTRYRTTEAAAETRPSPTEPTGETGFAAPSILMLSGGGGQRPPEPKKKDTQSVSFFLVTQRGLEPRTFALKVLRRAFHNVS